MTDLNHIHPDFRDAVEMPDNERLKFLRQERWLGYPAAEAIMCEVNDLLQGARQTRPLSYLILADANNGKTTLIEKFLERYGEAYVEDDGTPNRPVIAIQAPPIADSRALTLQLLVATVAPFRKSASTVSLRMDLIDHLRYLKTKMIIVDEFHSLISGGPKAQRQVMNTLKFISNELRISVVGFGTKSAAGVLHADPQYASRFEVLHLPQWNLDENFQSLLKGFEMVLPLREASKLYAPELATLIYEVSGGNLGNVRMALIELASQAIKAGDERITVDLVKRNSWLKKRKSGAVERPMLI